MAFNFLAGALLSSLTEGPTKGAGVADDNIFDRFAKDFDAPMIGDLFGGQAEQERGMQTESEDAALNIRLKARETQAEQTDLINDSTGQSILQSVLAGKDVSKLFGGI